MSTALETTNTLRQNHPSPVVYARSEWGPPDTWVEQPYLRCNAIEKLAAPEISRGTFWWKFGHGMQPDKNIRETFAPKNLPWRWVKVICPTPTVDGSEGEPIVWYGVFVDDERRHDGDLTVDGVRVENGQQMLYAVGLEFLLLRYTLEESYVGTTEDHRQIDRGLTFNSNDDAIYRGNRNSLGDGEKFFFCNKAAEGASWTHGQIVRYLVDTWLWINASAVSDQLVWELDADAAITAAGAFRETLPAHGRSVKELLDACLDRKRLLGYAVDVVSNGDGEAEKVVIRGFTFLKTAVELEEDGDLEAVTFAANPTLNLNFSSAVDVIEATTRRDSRTAYAKVVVQGARLTSCFSCQAGTILERGWTDEQETEYQTAASGEMDYPTDELEKLLRDSEFRKSDSLRPAFRHFLVTQDWDGKKGDNAVWPDLNQPEFDATLPAPFWRPGLRFLRHLPLSVGVDYSANAIETGDETTFNPEDSQPDYVAPMCLIPLPDDGTRYTMAELASATKAGGDPDATAELDPPYEWSCDVRMLYEDAGIELKVSGAPQHVICSDEFTKTLDSDVDAEANWKEFIFVVAALSDQHVQVSWPATPPPEPDEPEPEEDEDGELPERGPDAPTVVNPDVEPVLPIRMPDAEVWYVVPGTVVGVRDGKLKTSEGGFLRDDRPRMRRAAKIAYSYYATPRRAFKFVYRQVSGVFIVGQMIGTIVTGDKTIDVGSVVTRVAWDFVRGTTEIQTDHAELDSRVFGRRAFG